MTTKPKATICACGEAVYKGVRCQMHFNESRRIKQEERRKRERKRCQCGRLIGAQSKQCRNCNMAELGSATAQRRANAPEPVARPVAVVFTGLRGPGGAMEAELQVPTLYRPAAWGRS